MTSEQSCDSARDSFLLFEKVIVLLECSINVRLFDRSFSVGDELFRGFIREWSCIVHLSLYESVIILQIDFGYKRV